MDIAHMKSVIRFPCAQVERCIIEEGRTLWATEKPITVAGVVAGISVKRVDHAGDWMGPVGRHRARGFGKRRRAA